MGWWIFGSKQVSQVKRPPIGKVGRAVAPVNSIGVVGRAIAPVPGNHMADLLTISGPLDPGFHGEVDPDDALDPDAESSEADYGVGASGASTEFDPEASGEGGPDGSDESYELDDNSDDDAASYEPAEEDLEGIDIDGALIGCEVGLSGATMRK